MGEDTKARGFDIYDQHRTTRHIFVLSSDLAPGDSGGALVDPNGNVEGVAFAIAPDQPNVAYALTLDEVRPVLASAGSEAGQHGAVHRVTDSPTFTRAERCPRCGQPLVMGACTLCGPERAPMPPPAVTSNSPTLLSGGPPPPRPTVEPSPPGPPLDRTQTLLAVGIALLVVSLLASLFLILKVTSLDSKLKDERNARTDAEARIATLEGSVKGVQDDQQSLHSQLDAQAAADPTAISTRVQPSVYTVETPGGSLGSAWVASSDHVTANFVTNYHVIADAWEAGDTAVSVFQDEGRVLDGTILQALPDVDLALISVTADIPALKQSNETPRAGEAVLVIGSPFGLGGSVTTGRSFGAAGRSTA